MRGISRTSLETVDERLGSVLASADTAALGRELFEVAALLDREHTLRRWLADPANPAEGKSGLAGNLLEAKVSPATILVVGDIVQARWSNPRDLVAAVERAAVFATVAGAEGEQRLGEVEDELFRFGRILSGEPELRAALTNEAATPAAKAELVGSLLGGKSDPATSALVTEVVTRPRGRTLEQGLEYYGQLVAERAQRYVALVRTAVALSDAQQERLRTTLSRAYGRPIHLNIDVDPKVLGGLSIRVGDEVIDGTIAGRLSEVRRRLAG
ncbi:F0F1 ATP synthase subunit delta [Streptomonospora nanhaiensis]|uniref:ATP synthase subunit delta n=1 Tax=Streptomonospora nanhaiensis TaxID=1323731 RepID=A0A853BME2_9ACTN|nr:F0F1 ATP synthase subunit delta [Streptomonospora nanhaiensis]MBV2365306.1 F0F1 ATP synthase subunit delta [Streptomonospora nanhaiensis]MBX9390634.1 F0F1 ATP synthase subunit delta [Streptomonospora nanhaiensis]NYI95875.1 F-type H+-transporting ATPase subunit delta [Streptomonospora nanhaiensis]